MDQKNCLINLRIERDIHLVKLERLVLQEKGKGGHAKR